MNFNIPVSADHIRTIKDPQNENVKILHALVNVNDIPPDLPLDPDPRRPKEKGKVPQRISSSLSTNDGRFHLLNRGITMSVERYEYDNKENLLFLYLPEGGREYGIIDGGHTFNAITTTVQRERESLLKSFEGDIGIGGENSLRVLENQYVHLEIIENVTDATTLSDIAEARNYSVQLKTWTLANHRQKFDWLLEAIGPEYAKWVRVSENDEEPVGILDILRVFAAVNPDLFPDETPAVDAYKYAYKVLDCFIDPADKYGFKKFMPICRDVLRLYDYIRFNYAKKYREPDETGRRGRYGATVEVKQELERKRGLRKRTTYYFYDSGEPVMGEMPVPDGFALPMISGFRMLIVERKGKFQWRTDPFKFFDKYGNQLTRAIKDASDNAKGDKAQSVGRDPQVYRLMTKEVHACCVEAENKVLVDEIEKLKASLARRKTQQ